MPSDAMQFVLDMLADTPVHQGATVEERRATMDAVTGANPVAEGTETEAVEIDGVAAEWVRAPGVDAAAALLYLHGGGYCVGSIASHRPLASRLSAAGGLPVLVLGYRLAPEHPYPAALDDTLSAYRWLGAHGLDPSRLAIGGDSAGGGLTLAALLALRDAGEPLPAAAFGLSPWTDLTMGSTSVDRFGATDPVVSVDSLTDDVAWYAGEHRLDDPLISPAFADLSGLPPLLLHAAASEALLDDSVTVARRVAEAGGEVTLGVRTGVFHVWHAAAGMTPESDRAVAEVGHFLRVHRPA